MLCALWYLTSGLTSSHPVHNQKLSYWCSTSLSSTQFVMEWGTLKFLLICAMISCFWLILKRVVFSFYGVLGDDPSSQLWRQWLLIVVKTLKPTYWNTCFYNPETTAWIFTTVKTINALKHYVFFPSLAHVRFCGELQEMASQKFLIALQNGR